MRARKAGLAALAAITGLWMSCAGEPAVAAARPAAKKDAKAIVASADRPIVLSKFKKQRHASAAKKSRTVQGKNLKKSASKASSRTIAEKASSEKAGAQKTAAKDAASNISKNELPPEVANARAQALADDQARNIAALDNANVSNVNGVLVAAADTPADAEPMTADSAAVEQEAAPAAAVAPPPTPSGKIIRAMPSGERQVLKADDSDTWNKTSLVGKIFIAFGSLLTLASAARLLIA
ncbi:hypothetical protein BH10PSE10_BH10PSE10_21430 [soil metagenome]